MKKDFHLNPKTQIAMIGGRPHCNLPNFRFEMWGDLGKETVVPTFRMRGDRFGGYCSMSLEDARAVANQILECIDAVEAKAANQAEELLANLTKKDTD
mgnify:CR=1 FL=1